MTDKYLKFIFLEPIDGIILIFLLIFALDEIWMHTDHLWHLFFKYTYLQIAIFCILLNKLGMKVDPYKIYIRTFYTFMPIIVIKILCSFYSNFIILIKNFATNSKSNQSWESALLHFTNNQNISIGDLIEDFKIYTDVLISIILWLFNLSQIINLKTCLRVFE